jgi:hypothetical protein
MMYGIAVNTKKTIMLTMINGYQPAELTSSRLTFCHEKDRANDCTVDEGAVTIL